MKILVTGAAGFIGMHVVERLLAYGEEVVGMDNLNDYYDVNLKKARLARIEKLQHFRFIYGDIASSADVAEIFANESFDRVVHLAAQAGVRYSLVNPHSYIQSNLFGFINILEGCRNNDVQHLVYASSSSVYGGNEKLPFSEHDSVDHPVSLYAATKKSNELMAHTYSHLFRLPTTGLRFFTVYGPWGRPDMALSLFAKAMIGGNPIDIFNHGLMERAFTYIDDVVDAIVQVLHCVAEPATKYEGRKPDPATSNAPYRVLNVGSDQSVSLRIYIESLEQALGITAKKNYLPLQDGDMPATNADIAEITALIGWAAKIKVPDGVQRFAAWYREYHDNNKS